MSFVALAILDFERHSLEGLVVWHYNQLLDGVAAPPSLERQLRSSRRVAFAAPASALRMIQGAIERWRGSRAQHN
jgi:hypothetical protein